MESMGFIGGGQMAEALARGLLRAGLLAPDGLIVTDPSAKRRAVFTALGGRAEADNAAAAGCPVVWLAIKPQVVGEVLAALDGCWGAGPLVVSIMAGVTTARLAGALPRDARVVRVMPNTPMLIGAGASAVARGPGATEDDVARVCAWLSAVGSAREVAESDLDAVTALSGSGPAYVFALAEWLRDAGVAAGLAPELAGDLARDTLNGAARLLSESGEAPEVLRGRVTSPGGTTAAALGVFDRCRAADVVREAVLAAKRRGMELGK